MAGQYAVAELEWNCPVEKDPETGDRQEGEPDQMTSAMIAEREVTMPGTAPDEVPGAG